MHTYCLLAKKQLTMAEQILDIKKAPLGGLIFNNNIQNKPESITYN